MLQKNELKVIHVISGDLWAGAEVMVFHLISQLKKFKENQILIIMFNKGKLQIRLEQIGAKVCLIEERNNNIVKIIRKMHEIFFLYQPNIIHSHGYKENITTLLSIAFSKRPKLIATQHGLPEIFGRSNNFKYKFVNYLNLFLLKIFFNFVVVVSQDLSTILEKKLKFKKRKLRLIYNGITIPKLQRYCSQDAKKIIGSAGRFVSVKDYPLMIKIASHISELNESIHFKLAGDGPENAHLSSLVQNFDLSEKFQIIAFQDNIYKFLKGIDLYLITSLHEGIPLSVLEAMSLGIPVVAARVGGLQEIVRDGINGFLVDSRKPEDYAIKCLEILSNMKLYKKLSDSARATIIEKFSVKEMSTSYRNLYKSVININSIK